MSILDRPVFVPTGSSAGSLWRALGLTFTLALVAFAILLPVMQSSDEAAQGYRIRALEQQQVDLQAKIYSTQSEIAQLGSLARVDREARSRLGMVPEERTVGVSISAPLPSTHRLPNYYFQPATQVAPPANDSVWQKLLRLLPFN
jgi:hypothetical protein